MRRIASLILGVVCTVLLSSGFAGAADFAIKEKQEELIKQILGKDMEASGKYVADTFTMVKNRIRACYKTKGIGWCADLLHSSKRVPGSYNGGDFTIVPADGGRNAIPGKYLSDLAKVVKNSNLGDIWVETGVTTDSVEGRRQKAELDFPQFIMELLDDGLEPKAKKAIEILDNIGLENVDTVPLWTRLATQTGKFEEAGKLVVKIKDKPLQTIEKARLLLFQQKIDEGLAEFRKYLLMEKESKEQTGCDVDKIAKYLFKNGKKEEALAIRRKAVEVFPKCTLLWERLTESLLDLGLEDEALTLLEPLTKTHPDDVPILTAYANTLRRQKKREESSEVFLKLYNQTKRYGFLRMYSTVVSQTPDSMHLLEKEREYLKKDPESPIHRHAAGVLSYYNGFYQDSIKYMDQMRKELPEDARTYIYGAMSRYELGDWDGAKEWLDALSKLGPADPDLYYCYAVLYHKKNPEKSLRYIDQYLKVPLNPDSHPPKRAKAIGYRQKLLNGEPIPPWEPFVERQKNMGCNSTQSNNGFSIMFILLAAWLCGRKRISE